MEMNRGLSGSKHFRLQQLAAGVYAAIHIDGGAAVGKPDSLQRMREYVSTLDTLACQMVESGEPEERIDEMAIPAPFADWLFAAFYPLNMHFLYQRWDERRTEATD